MLATALIVFREVLEAALVVGIVLAASRGVPRRFRWVAGGISGGVLGAVLVAAFAGEIAQAVQGVGQELFNAAVLFLAVGMLGWHNVWMGRHGREMARDMKAVGHAVSAGSRPLSVLAVVVGVAVLREGSETVLFLYGITASGGDGLGATLLGCGLGLAAGIAMGALLYYGLVAIPVRHLFGVTSWLVTLLAAGMAAQAVQFLAAAGVLEVAMDPLWDSSQLLSETSLVGRLLRTLVGYADHPSLAQLAAYCATLLAIPALSRVVGRQPNTVRE